MACRNEPSLPRASETNASKASQGSDLHARLAPGQRGSPAADRPDLIAHVELVVQLPEVTVHSIEAALGVTLRKADENAQWVFFTGGPEGFFSSVSFKRRLDGAAWLLSFDYDPTSTIHEGDLDLSRYGPIVNVDVIPDKGPRGTHTLVYHYQELELHLQFTARSRRLLGAALHKNL